MVPICAVLPGQEVEQLFRLIDADGDGTLDYVELDIVMKTVQERKSKQGRVTWPQPIWGGKV